MRTLSGRTTRPWIRRPSGTTQRCNWTRPRLGTFAGCWSRRCTHLYVAHRLPPGALRRLVCLAPLLLLCGAMWFPGLPSPLRWQSVDGAVHRGSLWFSSAGSTTAIHYDHEHNMFVQLSGRKRFTLVSPKHHNKLHLHPSLHPSWRQCTWRATVLRRANTWPGNSDIMRYFRVGHCVLCSPSCAPTSPRQPVLSGVR